MSVEVGSRSGRPEETPSVAVVFFLFNVHGAHNPDITVATPRTHPRAASAFFSMRTRKERQSKMSYYEMSYYEAIADNIPMKKEKQGFTTYYPPCRYCGTPTPNWAYNPKLKYTCAKCKNRHAKRSKDKTPAQK